MSLRRVQRTWNHLGRRDPMWAVLTYRRDWGEDEFFATGVEEIDELMAHLAELEIAIERGRAVDFGCGLGRLTRPLADHFDEAVGIDISASMVERARELHADCSGCTFVVNPRPDLRVLETASVDFVYSMITLQHMPASAARGYIVEFARILRPGGAVVFQMPTAMGEGARPRGLAAAVRRARGMVGLAVRLGRRNMEMHTIPRQEVVELLTGAGATVVEVAEDERAGRDWKGFRYTAVMNAP